MGFCVVRCATATDVSNVNAKTSNSATRNARIEHMGGLRKSNQEAVAPRSERLNAARLQPRYLYCGKGSRPGHCGRSTDVRASFGLLWRGRVDVFALFVFFVDQPLLAIVPAALFACSA